MQNTIKNVLEENKLKYQILLENEHQSIFKLGMQLENGRVDTFVDIRPENKQVLIFTLFPTNIPTNQRNRVSEFITRANKGLIIGNFELDMEDGELRYKASYIYDDTFPISKEVFMHNFFTTLVMMDKFLPGVMSVIYANTIPRQAISQIENISNPAMN
jgi:hypothetical protein